MTTSLKLESEIIKKQSANFTSKTTLTIIFIFVVAVIDLNLAINCEVHSLDRARILEIDKKTSVIISPVIPCTYAAVMIKYFSVEDFKVCTTKGN